MKLHFVTCVSQMNVLNQRLLASPCLQGGRHPLTLQWNAHSAAEAFNTALQTASASWLIWVHQDVFLPQGWDMQFIDALQKAQKQFPQLAVAGVYGVASFGASLRRVGHVLDRGNVLKESTSLPYLVDSLDELLFAVRVDSGLRLDPALGFDFYATDIVLQAQAKGLQGAVLDAYCEHWSDTPVDGKLPQKLRERVAASGQCFEQKWQHRLPVATPCFEIHQLGDVGRCIQQIQG